MFADDALKKSEGYAIVNETMRGQVVIYHESFAKVGSSVLFHVVFVPSGFHDRFNESDLSFIGSYDDLDIAITAALSYGTRDSDWMPASLAPFGDINVARLKRGNL